MPDVSQYRTDLESVASSYRGSLDASAGGKPLEPHMLLAFMLLYALNQIDEILTKLDDDDDDD